MFITAPQKPSERKDNGMKAQKIILVSSLLFWSGLATASAQGTAFTYQGQLMANGSVANGSYDLTFTVWDAASGPNQISGTVTNSSVVVSNGLFTVLMDFGAGVFIGNSRWLEISVRPAGSGPFTTLAPRQAITPAPYAIFAATGAGGPWSVSGSNTFYTAGNVGIGTASPATALQIKGTAEGLRVDGPSAGAANQAYLSFRDANGTRIGYVGDASSADTSVFLNADFGDVVLSTFAGRMLVVRNDGRVTIGASGQLYVPAGEENLRIVRGVVSGAGGIIVGSGFTVSHVTPTSGQYTVTFNTAFNGAPAVTATADLNGRIISTAGVVSSSANFQTRDSVSGLATDAAFHFIAIGPR
jgi:hypothetical protein